MEDAEKQNGENGVHDVFETDDDDDQTDLVAAYQKVMSMGADNTPLNAMQGLEDINEEEEEEDEGGSNFSDSLDKNSNSINREKTGPSKQNTINADPLSKTNRTNKKNSSMREDINNGTEKSDSTSEKQPDKPQNGESSPASSLKAVTTAPKHDLRKLVDRVNRLYVEFYNEKLASNAKESGCDVAAGENFLRNLPLTIDDNSEQSKSTRLSQLELANVEPENNSTQRLILCRSSSLIDPDCLVSLILRQLQGAARDSDNGKLQKVVCPIVLNYNELMARIGSGSFSSSAHISMFVNRMLRSRLCLPDALLPEDDAAVPDGKLNSDEFDFLIKHIQSICALMPSNSAKLLAAQSVQLSVCVIIEDLRCNYLDELHPIWTAISEFQNSAVLLLGYDYLMVDKQHECETKRFTDFWYAELPANFSSAALIFPPSVCALQSYRKSAPNHDSDSNLLYKVFDHVLTDQLAAAALKTEVEVGALCDLLCHVCFIMLGNPAKIYTEETLIVELARAGEKEDLAKRCLPALFEAEFLRRCTANRDGEIECFGTSFKSLFSGASWQQFCVARHLLRRTLAERAKNAGCNFDFDVILRISDQVIATRAPVFSCFSLALIVQSLLGAGDASDGLLELLSQFVARRGASGRFVSTMKQFESNVLRTIFLNAIRICYDATQDAAEQARLCDQLLALFATKSPSNTCTCESEKESDSDGILLNFADLIEFSNRSLSESLLKTLQHKVIGVKFSLRSCTSDLESRWLANLLGLLGKRCTFVSLDASSWRSKHLKTTADSVFSSMFEKVAALHHIELAVDQSFLRCYGDAFETDAAKESADAPEFTKFAENSGVKHFDLTIRHRATHADSQSGKVGVRRRSNCRCFLERLCLTVLDEQSQVRSVSLRGCLLNRDVAKVLVRYVPVVKSLEVLSIGCSHDLTAPTAAGMDACVGGCTEMGGVNAFSEMLKFASCSKVVLDLDTYGASATTSGSTDEEIVMASVLKALQRNANVKELLFRSRTVPHSVLETLADTVERCVALETVTIQTHKMYDLLVDNLGNAVMCQPSLRTLKLLSARFDAFSPNALMTFIQACLYSPELQVIEIQFDESTLPATSSSTSNGLTLRLVEAAIRSIEQFALSAIAAAEHQQQQQQEKADDVNNGDTQDGDAKKSEEKADEEEEKKKDDQLEATLEDDIPAEDLKVRSPDCPLTIRFVGAVLNEPTKVGKRKPEEAIEQLKQTAAKLTSSIVRIELDQLRI